MLGLQIGIREAQRRGIYLLAQGIAISRVLDTNRHITELSQGLTCTLSSSAGTCTYAYYAVWASYSAAQGNSTVALLGTGNCGPLRCLAQPSQILTRRITCDQVVTHITRIAPSERRRGCRFPAKGTIRKKRVKP